MFERFEPFDRIVVTGPQRSGTTICGKIIAHDLNYRYVDEMGVSVRDIKRVMAMFDSGERFVLQCPALCRYVHHFANRMDTAVIMMRRPIAAIIASQERIDWTRRFEKEELSHYGVTTGPIAAVKYAYWDAVQRRVIRFAFEVRYEDLAGHPLWVDQADRKQFKPKQTA